MLKLLRRPFDEIQQKYLQTFRQEMKAWKKKDDEADDDEEREPRPVLKRCLVGDTTTESLAMTLNDNPRGLPMVRDELRSLVTSMNQYKGGKGQDRQIYLALWAGETIIIDRKSDKSRDGAPLFVRDPFTAITGGLQPAVLRDLGGDSSRKGAEPDDGFLDRFLFGFPEPLKAKGEQWLSVSDTARAAWAEVVQQLLNLSMVTVTEPAAPRGATAEEGVFAATAPTADDESHVRPFLVNLTTCGRKSWKQFTDAHAAELNDPDFPAYLAGPWSKLKGYCARLALIVHVLRWVCGESRVQDVDGESMDRGSPSWWPTSRNTSARWRRSLVPIPR